MRTGAMQCSLLLNQVDMHMPATDTTPYKKRFLIRRSKHWFSIATEHIACFVLEDRYVTLTTLDQKQHPISDSLERLEAVLCPQDFFRINRHTIVSYASIGQIAPWFNGRLRIEPVSDFSYDLVVSRSRVPGFKQWLDL